VNQDVFQPGCHVVLDDAWHPWREMTSSGIPLLPTLMSPIAGIYERSSPLVQQVLIHPHIVMTTYDIIITSFIFFVKFCNCKQLNKSNIAGNVATSTGGPGGPGLIL
jgi:hypothetical protein